MDKIQHFICDCYYDNIWPIGAICPKCRKAGQSHFKIIMHQVPCRLCGALVERRMQSKVATCFECKRDRMNERMKIHRELKKKKSTVLV